MTFSRFRTGIRCSPSAARRKSSSLMPNTSQFGSTAKASTPLAAERLPNGNTLIGDARQGRVIEVTPARKLSGNTRARSANMRMRNAHRTPNGTTLIAVEAEAKLIEVDHSGKIIWSWQAPEKTNAAFTWAGVSQRQHADEPFGPRRNRRGHTCQARSHAQSAAKSRTFS